jgi:hypothetical protein
MKPISSALFATVLGLATAGCEATPPAKSPVTARVDSATLTYATMPYPIPVEVFEGPEPPVTPVAQTWGVEPQPPALPESPY